MAAASIMSSQPPAEAGCSLKGRMKHGAKSIFCSSSSRPCHLSSHERSEGFAAPEPWTDSAENAQVRAAGATAGRLAQNVSSTYATSGICFSPATRCTQKTLSYGTAQTHCVRYSC
jgi:hypothetical protein